MSESAGPRKASGSVRGMWLVVWVGSILPRYDAIMSCGIAARLEVPGAGAVIANASEVRVRYLYVCEMPVKSNRTRKRDRGLCVSAGFRVALETVP